MVLLTCSYRGKEFVRIGYYVNNEYTDPELNENPPTQPVFQKVIIDILIFSYRIIFSSVEEQTSKSKAMHICVPPLTIFYDDNLSMMIT